MSDMDLSFKALKTDIAGKWGAMQIKPQHIPEIDQTADKLLADKDIYLELEKRTGVPALITMVISERESGGNLRCSLAQGDRWDRVSVHVPRGRGPFKSWLDAAIDALQLQGMTGKPREYWTMERALYDPEDFNGFGYRLRLGKEWPSPYVWAMTTIQRRGKFVSDGKFDSSAWDDQVGVAALMARLIKKDPTLALPSETPVVLPNHPSVIDVEVPDTEQIQTILNKLGAKPPLEVDGDYGDKTKEAAREYQLQKGLQPDGRVGPLTWHQMQADVGIG